MENNIRYVARVFIETTSTLAINSGDKSLLLDNSISRDANQLPYIPGTSIAGVLQHACAEQKNKFSTTIGDLFGAASNDAIEKGLLKDEEQGSRLIFSSAHLVSSDGVSVIDGLIDYSKDLNYISYLFGLPQRDHVRITDRGVADSAKSGKFDRELVHKGVRFCFEIELVGTDSDETDWLMLIGMLQNSFIRFGSGTRKGSGAFKVLENQSSIWKFNLEKESELLAYLNKSSSLNSLVSIPNEKFPNAKQNEDWELFSINISPEDFFLFGAGTLDKEADNIAKKENYISWVSGSPKLEEYYLIPATSVKGAISHRIAFHYNNLEQNFIGRGFDFQPSDFDWNVEDAISQIFRQPDLTQEDLDKYAEEASNISFEDEIKKSKQWKKFERNTKNSRALAKPLVSEENTAVKEFFGEAKKENSGLIGKVIIDDIYLEKAQFESKIFNHVKIDRLTGGAVPGALFQEKAIKPIEPLDLQIDIWVKSKALSDNVKKAFELTLQDLKAGMLPLGGATTKGYGNFKTTQQ